MPQIRPNSNYREATRANVISDGRVSLHRTKSTASEFMRYAEPLGADNTMQKAFNQNTVQIILQCANLGKLQPQIISKAATSVGGRVLKSTSTRGVFHLQPDGYGESPPWVMEQHRSLSSFGMTLALSFLQQREILQMAGFANFSL